MSPTKRKADEQLTRRSVSVIEPIIAERPASSPGILSRLWNCVTRYFCVNSTATYTEMSHRPGRDVVADDHTEISRERKDGTVTLKRQRLGRSKSTTDVSTKGSINYAGCDTDEQKRDRQNEFWEAPPLKPWKSAARPQTPIESTSELSELEDSTNLLSLDTAERSLITPSPSPPPPAFRTTSARPLSNKPIRPSKSTGDFASRVSQLFDAHAPDEPLLHTSTYKRVELDKLREHRERQRRDATKKATKERRLRRQRPLRPLIQPLLANWDDSVNQILYSKDRSKVFAKSMEGNDLRKHDFTTLLGDRQWLNDEVINTYIEWVANAANAAIIAEDKANGEPTSTVPKVFAHSSFFYTKLAASGPQQFDRLMKRKKMPGASLLEVETLLIPINKGSHWTLGVVRPVARTIEYFDSMGNHGGVVIQHLQGWVKHMLGPKYVESEWTTPRTPCAYQSNGYDCGVFVCTNAFCIALGLDPTCYHETDLIQQRKNIAAVILNRGFVGDFAWNTEGFLS